ncbi:MAG TPA: nucleotide exchange factor GrpE [Candidatus Kapabacteria bacterium]|nr:nucleotide exchange factor GrpE [Candidatus Kapabacteria bacterium]
MKKWKFMTTNKEELANDQTGSNENDEQLEETSSAGDRIVELERELQEAREQSLRRTAEMDNMRRRFNQEREVLIFEGNKRLLTELLPVVDDLERTLQHAEKGKLTEGVELVYKGFLKTLDRYGVKPMDVIGKPFDVHAHDALMEEATTDSEPGIVLKEIQKGYMLNDSVLRHAKVIVSKAPDA